MIEYLALHLLGELTMILSFSNINMVDTYIAQSILPDHNLTIDNLNIISPIDDHLTYGRQF